MEKLVKIRHDYLRYLDHKARRLGYLLSVDKKVTKLILWNIIELYQVANVDSVFENNIYESAYHNPVTSDLEFLISRILYHYAKYRKLNWKIFLRRQVGKTAPDIRIEKNNITIAIIEIKAKAGWIQPFFSKERYVTDLLKYKNNESDFNPQTLIRKVKTQLSKYKKNFKIDNSNIYLLLPTLTLVHRKNSSQIISDYINQFAKNSKLPKNNFVLLSENLLLNLGNVKQTEDLCPTNDFEKFVHRIGK